jgi:hypothetical protein
MNKILKIVFLAAAVFVVLQVLVVGVFSCGSSRPCLGLMPIGICIGMFGALIASFYILDKTLRILAISLLSMGLIAFLYAIHSGMI